MELRRGQWQRAARVPVVESASSLAIDCSYANYDYGGTAYCLAYPGAANRVGSESPKGDGKYGQADLAGNVWEWTLIGVTEILEKTHGGLVPLAIGNERGFWRLRASTFLSPSPE
jgi:formylglycine-generating enzyme required for sulfatase activity